MNSEELTNNIITPLSLCTLDTKELAKVKERDKTVVISTPIVVDIVKILVEDIVISWNIHTN